MNQTQQLTEIAQASQQLAQFGAIGFAIMIFVIVLGVLGLIGLFLRSQNTRQKSEVETARVNAETTKELAKTIAEAVKTHDDDLKDVIKENTRRSETLTEAVVNQVKETEKQSQLILTQTTTISELSSRFKDYQTLQSDTTANLSDKIDKLSGRVDKLITSVDKVITKVDNAPLERSSMRSMLEDLVSQFSDFRETMLIMLKPAALMPTSTTEPTKTPETSQ